MKKFKIGFRIEGMVEVEVVADSWDEAYENAPTPEVDDFWAGKCNVVELEFCADNEYGWDDGYYDGEEIEEEEE